MSTSAESKEKTDDVVHEQELAEKYDKTKAKPAATKPEEANKADEGSLLWLKLELSRFYGFVALAMMSLMRLAEAQLEWRPLAAMYIFPIISLKFFDSKVLGLALTAATQIFINFLVFPGFGDNSNDLPLTLGLIVWFWILAEFITPNLGLQAKKKNAVQKLQNKDKEVKEPEVHIVYHMLFSCLSFMAFLQFAINMNHMMYSPLHCALSGENSEVVKQSAVNSTAEAAAVASSPAGTLKCEWEKVEPISLAISELWYIIAFIFSMGPLKIFLKIQEGKTSMAKIVEDYEENRGFMGGSRSNGPAENRGLLPTTTRPRQRTARTTEANEGEHM